MNSGYNASHGETGGARPVHNYGGYGGDSSYSRGGYAALNSYSGRNGYSSASGSDNYNTYRNGESGGYGGYSGYGGVPNNSYPPRGGALGYHNSSSTQSRSRGRGW